MTDTRWLLIREMYREAFKAALREAKQNHEAMRLPVGFAASKSDAGGCAVRLEFVGWSDALPSERKELDS